ncbi:uncharacterized protein EV422DRAFT_196492 [Fimicolochytrium jonesii]|uniref:uncharacterized protein n=1 Tax=Fimicolochytrium jonesii TaxID=1396493 RepID=UPI0022FE9EDE|nr:uncharacterized protein EV422DRAFT_196492 [Fimicolochytrium jonesii]KAI8818264.1 hypothetical protein EV422DRAFT_196492 [Fimicolochytrium jonesii]
MPVHALELAKPVLLRTSYSGSGRPLSTMRERMLPYGRSRLSFMGHGLYIIQLASQQQTRVGHRLDLLQFFGRERNVEPRNVLQAAETICTQLLAGCKGICGRREGLSCGSDESTVSQNLRIIRASGILVDDPFRLRRISVSRRRVISPFLSCIVLAGPTFAAAPNSTPQPTDGERLVSFKT